MSIDLMFDDTCSLPSPWDAVDTAKLAAALEVLQRRHERNIDQRTERQYIWHAIGGLWTVLRTASKDPMYDDEHPAEVDPYDLPF